MLFRKLDGLEALVPPAAVNVQEDVAVNCG